MGWVIETSDEFIAWYRDLTNEEEEAREAVST
jgi:hypothetical protein